MAHKGSEEIEEVSVSIHTDEPIFAMEHTQLVPCLGTVAVVFKISTESNRTEGIGTSRVCFAVSRELRAFFLDSKSDCNHEQQQKRAQSIRIAGMSLNRSKMQSVVRLSECRCHCL